MAENLPKLDTIIRNRHGKPMTLSDAGNVRDHLDHFYSKKK